MLLSDGLSLLSDNGLLCGVRVFLLEAATFC